MDPLASHSTDNRACDDYVEHLARGAGMVPAPLASVVMVAYNHADFLAEAIESVLGQEAEFPFELLIGDDCSTDSTMAVALDFQGRFPGRIRCFSGRNNVGQHRNYARLVAECRGEFIAYCDGDDYWSARGKLQRQVDYLREREHVGAVHTDFDRILFRDGRWRRNRSFLASRFKGGGVPEGSIFERLLSGNFIQTCTLCMRANLVRDFMTSGLLKPEYSVNDWPLFLYIAARADIDFLPGSTAVYRKSVGSLTNSGMAARAKFVAGYIPMIEDFCALHGVADDVRNAALAVHYRQLASFSALAGNLRMFESARAWLNENESDFTKSWRGRALPVLTRASIGRRLLVLVQEAREQVRDRWSFR